MVLFSAKSGVGGGGGGRRVLHYISYMYACAAPKGMVLEQFLV